MLQKNSSQGHLLLHNSVGVGVIAVAFMDWVGGLGLGLGICSGSMLFKIK